MSTDSDVMQDFMDALSLHGAMKLPVIVDNICAGGGGLRDISGKADTSPSEILSCIRMLCRGTNPIYFRLLFDTPADVDDMWVHHWCPQPPGIDLSNADCPAGTTPLWTNGKATVFCRTLTDKHGNEDLEFSIYEV